VRECCSWVLAYQETFPESVGIVEQIWKRESVVNKPSKKEISLRGRYVAGVGNRQSDMSRGIH
jgi:hypothetical protein